MTTFTINETNEIVAFSSQEEAAAATATPFDSFSSQKELVELAKAWPAERLVSIFNSLTGVTPVESFKSTKAAVARIWERINQESGRTRAAASGTGREAEGRKKGHQPRTVRQGRARQGQGGQEDDRPQQRAQGQKGRQGEGCCRAAREQQDRPGGRHAATEGRSHAGRGYEKDGLAKTHRPGFHSRHHEKGRVRRRVFQAGGRGADLSDQ